MLASYLSGIDTGLTKRDFATSRVFFKYCCHLVGLTIAITSVSKQLSTHQKVQSFTGNMIVVDSICHSADLLYFYCVRQVSVYVAMYNIVILQLFRFYWTGKESPCVK